MSPRFSSLLSLGLFSLTLVALPVSEVAAESPPHIVVLLADDMSPGDFSAGNPDSKWQTPNIDRLAAQGMLFTQAHSPAASCTPTRYSFLTGRYPHRMWLKSGVTGSFGRSIIDPDETTVAEFLQDIGYQTGFVGKWHLGMTPEKGGSGAGGVDYSKPLKEGPNQHGFDFAFRATSAGNTPYVYIRDGEFLGPVTKKIEANKMSRADRERGVEGMEFHYSGGDASESFAFDQVQQVVTDESVQFIERSAKAGKPFFLYTAFSAPHHPMYAAEEFVGKSGIGPYGDFILELDYRVGQILAALEHAGVAENTLVIFSADNGIPPDVSLAKLQAQGHDSTMGLRGIKMDLFEGGHRVPFIARWPKHIDPGSQSDSVVGLNDLFATFADAASAELPTLAAGDSVSLLPALIGNTDWERAPLVVQSHHGTLALIDWPWKFLATPDSGGLWTPPYQGSPEAAKLPKFQLYNLAEDRGETTNQYPEQLEIAERMATELAEIVRRGRSTPGPDLKNEGGPIWKSVRWIKDFPKRD